MKIPFVINTTRKKLNGYTGFAFFLWIFIAKETSNRERTINHERIHFYQQLEMLFVLMWILYGLFFVINLFRYGNPRDAYMNNPFEREAYHYDDDLTYLKKRKLFTWVKFIF